MNLGLGIDTGGTYTDSVIIDLDTKEILCKAKALTTREDLAIGIADSVDALDSKLFPHIKLVSLSSTLATNSVVEGKGGRVGLIVVGRKFDRSIDVERFYEARGGHTVNGLEQEPLDKEGCLNFIRSVKDEVDAFAISSYFSVRNPSHEQDLKRLVKSETNLPVVCGHELSMRLGFPERTVTAILNAKLIPLISELLDSVKIALTEKNITAPIMIVKGDGSLMSEEMGRERPVETILSGPAASLIGAKFLAGLENAIVIDVGGTTTDIGVLRNGLPRVDPEGALVGGWRTRVKAADISTSGIGGDSQIIVSDGQIQLTPLRVVPLCIATKKYPVIKDKLKLIQTEMERLGAIVRGVRTFPQITEFFILSKMKKGLQMSELELEILNILKDEPRSVFELAKMLNVHPISINIQKFEELGVLQRIGLTPTDILHAMGKYVEYDAEPSKIAVEIQAARLNMDPIEFCNKVREMVINKIAKELLKKLIYEETRKFKTCAICGDFVEKFITGKSGADYSCRLKLEKPIIGVGAPVGEYLPPLADKFSTKVVLPKHAEVGNAFGAITGSVVESTEIVIRPKEGVAQERDPACYLFSEVEMKEFENLSSAMAYANDLGQRIVLEKARSAGAEEIELVVSNNVSKGRLSSDWGDDILLEVRLSIKGIGRPKQYV